MKKRLFLGLLFVGFFHSSFLFAGEVTFSEGTPYVTTGIYVEDFHLKDPGPLSTIPYENIPAVRDVFAMEGDWIDGWHTVDLKTHWKFQGEDNDWGIATNWASCLGCAGTEVNAYTHLGAEWLNYRQPGSWIVTSSWRLDGGEWQRNLDIPFTVTPEPASFLLFGLGAAALGWARRKNK